MRYLASTFCRLASLQKSDWLSLGVLQRCAPMEPQHGRQPGPVAPPLRIWPMRLATRPPMTMFCSSCTSGWLLLLRVSLYNNKLSGSHGMIQNCMPLSALHH